MNNKRRWKIYGLIIGILLFLATYSLWERILIYMGMSYKKIYQINISDEEIKSIYSDLKITDSNFSWRNRGPQYVNKPTMLVYHHTAIKKITVKDVDKLHKNKGWECIGYHYFISKSGEIYKGRPEEAEGAHALGQNKCSIGICLEGNFEEEYPLEAQIRALIKLSEYLCLKYDINEIVGHKDVGNTLCPGKNFPKEKVKKAVLKKIKNYHRDKKTAS